MDWASRRGFVHVIKWWENNESELVGHKQQSTPRKLKALQISLQLQQ